MTVTFDEGKPSLDELEHYGTKGMKWGVRKNSLRGQALNAKRSRLKALDPKKATWREKVNTPGIKAMREGGYEKAALKRRKETIDRQARVLQGKAKASEVLREIGNLSLIDIANRKKMK